MRESAESRKKVKHERGGEDCMVAQIYLNCPYATPPPPSAASRSCLNVIGAQCSVLRAYIRCRPSWEPFVQVFQLSTPVERCRQRFADLNWAFCFNLVFALDVWASLGLRFVGFFISTAIANLFSSFSCFTLSWYTSRRLTFICSTNLNIFPFSLELILRKELFETAISANLSLLPGIAWLMHE